MKTVLGEFYCFLILCFADTNLLAFIAIEAKKYTDIRQFRQFFLVSTDTRVNGERDGLEGWALRALTCGFAAA